ncbi:MAG: carbohydrate porin [Desulfobacterales bacterium]
MKRDVVALLVLMFTVGSGDPALAETSAILKELQALKERIEELEQKLEEQESLAKRQAAKSEAKMEEKIGEALEERFGTLEVHGGAILYYQESRTDELEGEKAGSPSGAGFSADLELTWKPALPVVEGGELFMRIHAGNGSGADRTGGGKIKPADVLLGNLNTIADDNSEKDGELQLLELHYTHSFFDGMLAITGGKGEQLGFLDDNAFANDEGAQFVGKPFVNNSVLDSENEYTPLIGLKFQPVELLSVSLVGASSSRPLVEDSPLAGTTKSNYDNLFSTPFIGSQITLSPKFGELQGNYRLYGWYAGYNHSKLDADRNFIDGKKYKGWGFGVSADQQITERVGLFGRFGWNNEDVYVVKWEASGGLYLKGLIPGREDDEIGIGFAGLVPDSRFAADDPEYHLEAYYRIAVTENLAFTPDLQYVWNPGGDSDNDPVFAGMVRAEFGF